ncbi:hypothetical protein [Borrelia sp. P9F1]|uniref:hypothetical protein n=1 Tax=Borrelia sp. P9F1 TaxID=3058374 RepID=UPI002648A5FB|nr:hypothetical protein [Borrelia sp. P9F1]WKC58710.1 hypothetical protein QYZ68_05765 [Borrelia sp. P9F1]
MGKHVLIFFMLFTLLMGCGQDVSSNNVQEEMEDEYLDEEDDEEEEEVEGAEEKDEETKEKAKGEIEEDLDEEDSYDDEIEEEAGKKDKKDEMKEEEAGKKDKKEDEMKEEAKVEIEDEEEKERESEERMAQGIYLELERKSRGYRAELERDKLIFISGGQSFPVLVNKLKGVGSSYANPGEMNKIYAGLGYDIDSIRKLEESFPGFTISMFGDKSGTVFIVASFLTLFVDINSYTQEMLNESLGNSNLAKARGIKKPAMMNLIMQKLDEFIVKRKELLEKIKSGLSKMEANKHNKSLVYDEMQKMTGGGLGLSAECARLGKISEDIKKLIQSR